MKKYKRFLLPLFALFPLLLANAPAPWPHPGLYEDFTHTAITMREDDDYYVYETTITNTGSGFISVSFSYMYNEPFYGKFDSHGSPLILPGASYDFVVYSKTLTAAESLKLRVVAYEAEKITEITDYTILNSTKTTYENTYDENFVKYYLYEFGAELEYPDDAYYSVVTVFDYEGETYAYIADYLNTNYPSFYAEEDLDLSLIEITNVYVIKGREYVSFGDIFMQIGRVFIAIILIQFLVIPGLIIGLVFIIRAQKKKRRLRLEHEQERDKTD